MPSPVQQLSAVPPALPPAVKPVTALMVLFSPELSAIASPVPTSAAPPVLCAHLRSPIASPVQAQPSALPVRLGSVSLRETPRALLVPSAASPVPAPVCALCATQLTTLSSSEAYASAVLPPTQLLSVPALPAITPALPAQAPCLLIALPATP